MSAAVPLPWQFQLPDLQVARARTILLAGCGGGYDAFGAIPKLCELRQMGKDVHLASLSFSSPGALRAEQPEPSLPNLFVLRSGDAAEDVYSPEAWLAHALELRTRKEESMWCLQASTAASTPCFVATKRPSARRPRT